MPSKAEQRLPKELMKVKSSKDAKFSVELLDDNLFTWLCKIQGPKNSPYENGIFKFKLVFPPEYPFHPPAVKAQTKVYHPNFDDNGDICLDLLRKENWTPMSGVQEVLIGISQMLENPNPEHPLDAKIAEEYMTNKKQFIKTAKEWTKKHASNK